MKTISAVVAVATSLFICLSCSAQDVNTTNTNSEGCNCSGDLAEATNMVAPDKPKEVSAQSMPGQQNFSLEEAEAKFKVLLNNVTLAGRWSPIKEGKLGPEKEDKYNIVNVEKLTGDSWVVNARLKYRDREFVAPIPVKVQWVGGTPVLIVDNVGMPGGSTTYSARVLFYEKTYSGTWKGGRGGGLLYGVITSSSETNQISAPASAPAAPGL